jgi:hypothetical protein
MPSLPHTIKQLVVNDLWLPLAKKGGDHLFPLKRKHKGMKLLTLTDMDYQEVKIFEENKLTKRENVVAWNHSYHQALRLEVELGPSKVLSIGRFDDVINDGVQEALDELPCDLLNIDFLSQNPISFQGRIEREINGENIIARRLNQLQVKGFVLFHTTLIDQIDLNTASLAFQLSLLPGFANPACNVADKAEFIRNALGSAMHNNNFVVSESAELLIDLEGGNKIFSIGYLSLRKI